MRFERAHFKSLANNALLFEAAFYVSDRDHNHYMDIQQAINLVIYDRLQKEGIAPVRQLAANERQEGAQKPEGTSRATAPSAPRHH